MRMSARSWFDAAIWRHVGVQSQAATVDAVAAIERFARTVAESADRHASSFGRIDESTLAMKRAAAQFHDVANSFHGEMKGVPQALHVLQDAMAASARALQELIPAGARAVANLDVSVAAFRTTIDKEFTEGVRLQHRSSKSLAAAMQQMVDSTDLLKGGAEELKKGAETLSGSATGLENAGTRLRQTLEKDVAPSQRTMHDAAAGFEKSSAQLTEFIEHGLAPATHQLARLHETLAGMEAAVDSIKRFSQARGDVDRLTAALARSAEIAEALASLPEQIRSMLEQTAVRQAEISEARGRKTWLGSRPR
jgi:chromosome segregation ATPase